MSRRQRFALVGVGQRGHHFVQALLGPHRHHAALVGLCDSCMPSLQAWQQELGAEHVPLYHADDFECMLSEQKVDRVLVMTPDHTHHEYICCAAKAGCDVITEKPLTTRVDHCQQIIDTMAASQRHCDVTFNYRYAPWNTAVKQTISAGRIGRITGGTLRHCLGNEHGPSYFHRWHAQQDHSGGLLVHKSSHFFDLINWFVDSVPKRVFARGGQHMFGPDQLEFWGMQGHADRCPDCQHVDRCPFARFTDERGEPQTIQQQRRAATGYSRDLCVFRPEADIPDVMHVLIEYESGIAFNYQVSAFGPPGSDGVLFGTHGRLTTNGGDAPLLEPHTGPPEFIKVDHQAGGHGGADPLLYQSLFDPEAPEDPYQRMADHHAGCWAVLIGLAAQQSIDKNQAIVIADLVDGLQRPSASGMQIPQSADNLAAMRAWVTEAVQAKRDRARKGVRTLADTFGANG